MTPTTFSTKPLGFPWVTRDPFLFCVYHNDHYPRGNDHLGPSSSLAGRNIGQDFELRDGWRMYHGQEVPGFPQHPHRGFETVTIVRKGLIDHSDSLGATARFGEGDTQWLTAGKGILHCEMFPLLEREHDNPLELFQIWLNLPKEDKLVDPHFTMLWDQNIPRKVLLDAHQRRAEITVVAGGFAEAKGPPPPPKSWASRADTDVAIWTIKLEPHARFTLPASRIEAVNRSLFFFLGKSLTLNEKSLEQHCAIEFHQAGKVEIENGPEESQLLLLQGRPIGQPVVQYGPFVMNSQQEIQQAFSDYRRTQFGGWPWPSDEPTHPREQGRFAKHVDGRVEAGK
jgi:quercetin 2,3-dioxygenase